MSKEKISDIMTKTELSHIETLENAVKWDYLKGKLTFEELVITLRKLKKIKEIRRKISQKP